jgi:uncharacterized membrane protein
MTTKTQESKNANGLLGELPIDRLKEEALGLGKALARKGVTRIGERMSGATDKLGDLADAAPGPKDIKAAGVKAAAKVPSPLAPVKEAASKVKDALPGTGSDDRSGGNGQAPAGDDTDLKVTNIVETIDVPVSRDVAYELWTQFEEFPSFMKKVETVKQEKPEVVTWKAQVLWSHRTWTAKIVDQVPPERIVWKSEGDKGRVDGAVTFHELAPDLTRVLVSLEYHPQGLFERTGNLWRAQGRRVRLELKHFRRHVANHALLHTDDVDGWEGEIHDGKVKRRRTSSSTAKKSTSNGTARKAPAKKSTAKKAPAKKSAAKKAPAKKTAAKKTAAKKAPAKKTAAKKAPAKRTAAKKAPAKKAAGSRSGSSARSARSKS